MRPKFGLAHAGRAQHRQVSRAADVHRGHRVELAGVDSWNMADPLIAALATRKSIRPQVPSARSSIAWAAPRR